MRLKRAGRNQLLFEHCLDEFAHFIVLVRKELLFESNSAKELVLVELGRTRGHRHWCRVLLFPLIAHRVHFTTSLTQLAVVLLKTYLFVRNAQALKLIEV